MVNLKTKKQFNLFWNESIFNLTVQPTKYAEKLYTFQKIPYNYVQDKHYFIFVSQNVFSLLLSISVTGQAWTTVKATKVCFLIQAFSSEPQGSHLLVLLAMRHGLKTNTQISTKIKATIIIVYKLGASSRLMYLVCPTSNGRDSVLHQPSKWHQRWGRRQERAGNTLLMRSKQKHKNLEKMNKKNTT